MFVTWHWQVEVFSEFSDLWVLVVKLDLSRKSFCLSVVWQQLSFRQVRSRGGAQKAVQDHGGTKVCL